MCSSGRCGSLVGAGPARRGTRRPATSARARIVGLRRRRRRPRASRPSGCSRGTRARRQRAPLSAHWRCRAAPCLLLRGKAPDVEPRAHAPEAVHAVGHVARHEGRHRLDDGAGALEGARCGLDRRGRPRVRRRGRSRRPCAGRGAALHIAPQVDPRRSSCDGRLMLSRQSGRLSTRIINAASRTLRVIGPATRPAYGGSIGNAAEARLQPEDAAPAGRQAHRAADVGAQVQRAVAGRGAGSRRPRCCRRGSCSDPRGCAPACGSSTGPTTTCRSRASSSCRGSPRRLSRSRAAGGASARPRRQLGGGRAEWHRHALRRDVLLERVGTPSSADSGSPCSQRASDGAPASAPSGSKA